MLLLLVLLLLLFVLLSMLPLLFKLLLLFLGLRYGGERVRSDLLFLLIFIAYPALEVSFTTVAANDRAGTVAMIVNMEAVAFHVVAAVAPPAAAATVDATVVALLIDIIIIVDIVLGSDIEVDVRRLIYGLHYFLWHILRLKYRSHR